MSKFVLERETHRLVGARTICVLSLRTNRQATTAQAVPFRVFRVFRGFTVPKRLIIFNIFFLARKRMMAFKSELPWLRMEATVVRIEDLGERPPVIEVLSAPAGYNIYVGPLVNNPTVEHGALINLLGVDQQCHVPESGWRFVDPKLPEEATRNGLDVLWITHDRSGPFSNGDLQIGFNTVFPGHHYANPIHTQDKGLGAVTNQWITVYKDDVLVLLFKPR